MGLLDVPASLRPWMSAVSEIVRAVNAAEPLEDVLTRVAVRACELIGFEFCAVMLADERRERLHIAGCSGLTADYLAQVSASRSLMIHPPGPGLDTPAARAYREGRTIVVPDVRDAPDYGRLRYLAPTQGYQALLASPLRGSGELAGVIVAYSVMARAFSEPELELIELLGGQAALALETARLRAEQQEVIRELSRANHELRRGRAVLEWAEQQHHQLMQLVLDEVELPGLVSALAATLRASVTVEDAEAVTSGGSVSDTSGSMTASVGRIRQWLMPVFTLIDITSSTHIAVLSEPVPAVVGTAIRGLSWWRGARPRPIGLLM